MTINKKHMRAAMLTMAHQKNLALNASCRCCGDIHELRKCRLPAKTSSSGSVVK